MKADEYRRGYHDGLREAISWLHARAEVMNDPHAKAILNTAAFHFGVEMAEKRRQFPIAGQQGSKVARMEQRGIRGDRAT